MARTWRHATISGAGSGIGHGLAVRLLKRGTRVSVFDLAVSAARAEALDAAAAHAGVGWQFHQCDITDEQGVAAAVASAVAACGPPDLAINSAGVGSNEAFADISLATFRRVLEINLVGSRNFAAAILPHMPVGSRLALIASLAGITSNYGYAAYGASKFGVIGLATTLRMEYEPLGINVTVVCPPEVATPMVEKEHATGNPIGLAVKQIAGTIGVDQACDGIMAGIDAGRWMVIPGFKGKLTAFVAQRMPGVFYAVTSRVIRKVMRQQGKRVV